MAPLAAVSRAGIQADRTQGKVLQAGLCAASSGWGEGTARPRHGHSWLVLGCPWRHELPTLRPSTAASAPRPPCNLLLPLFGVLFQAAVFHWLLLMEIKTEKGLKKGDYILLAEAIGAQSLVVQSSLQAEGRRTALG